MPPTGSQSVIADHMQNKAAVCHLGTCHQNPIMGVCILPSQMPLHLEPEAPAPHLTHQRSSSRQHDPRHFALSPVPQTASLLWAQAGILSSCRRLVDGQPTRERYKTRGVLLYPTSCSALMLRIPNPHLIVAASHDPAVCQGCSSRWSRYQR